MWDGGLEGRVRRVWGGGEGQGEEGWEERQEKTCTYPMAYGFVHLNPLAH